MTAIYGYMLYYVHYMNLIIQLLSKFFIDSDFVIIIYIPYTCLSVCNKLVLCLRYDLFLLLYARHI